MPTQEDFDGRGAVVILMRNDHLVRRDARPLHLLIVAMNVEAFRKRSASPIGSADPTLDGNHVEAGLRAPAVGVETNEVRR